MTQSQLDYVFASRGLHEQVTTRALNSAEEWGASDYCRILIDVGCPVRTRRGCDCLAGCALTHGSSLSLGRSVTIGD